MYRRSISSKFTLLTRRCHPSFTHLLLHDDNDKIHSGPVADPSQTQNGNFLQREFHRNYNHATAGLGALFRERRGFASSLPLGLGPSFCSYSSSTIGDGSDKVEYMSDVASVFTEKSMEVAVVQATVASEVAVAAADSFLPVAFLQYFIDGVHNVTGLNWWAAIALTTLMIRCATAPLLINQLKATSKLTQMRPHMEEIKQQMEDSMDPKAAAEGQKRMMALFQEYGVTPFTPLKGLFIQGPVFISFYLAVTNMVEKVPSFKGGGAFWFSDLTTPDTLYIFPVLTALSFLLTVEAIFCYWITSNLFSLVYGLVIKRPSVKKLLGLPEIVPQPTTAQQPSFYPFGGSKPLLGGLKSLFGESVSATTADPLTPVNQSKIPDTRISRSSNVGQRFSRLERTVKGRKRTKKN
ncbi:mitochondrial inner membrane protein OXA1-like isoform X2 [Magnolia sinica]|uniref:mitochondrial inner membrane protein OXA1-like isoform X2 n=1 Tax=Magnolia sinica TaxID=86752 RepID=UPI00265A5F96|nr:mitochondrial inner membrane protein OXA1-like isoform X2 [Magnolia sinica]